MLKYIFKRLIISLAILLMFSFIMYCIISLFRFSFIGIHIPIFPDYFIWLSQSMIGNFGYSRMLRMPVAQALQEHMWVSIMIVLIGLIVAYLIAIPLGTLAGTKKNSKFDTIASTLSLVSVSFPAFFICVIFIRIFAVGLGWFPMGGMITANLPYDTTATTAFFNRAWHFILPIAVIAFLNVGELMRLVRVNNIEVLSSDYIRTAKAFGIKNHAIIGKFALKNTAVPLSTYMATFLPTVFAGSFIVEILFALPGVGFAAWRALLSFDVPLLMGFYMFIGLLTVLGNFLSDIAYAVLNPQIRLN